MICDNLSVNEVNHLCFAGYDTVELAAKYGTPLMLMDENKIREHIRTYKTSMEKHFPLGSVPEFASKAFSCKQIYRIMSEEGIHIDVVSPGEIYTARQASFDMSGSFFHGNNKSDEDISFAMDNGVGHFVADSLDELYAIDKIAEQKGILQKVLMRLTPGIDPHTHKKISTGSVDSKFGIAIESGEAIKAVGKALMLENINLIGFHCHVGSQIFESAPFIDAADIMLGFISDVKNVYGYEAEVLNLGGGFGVRYTENDPVINYEEKIAEIAAAVNSRCDALNISAPKIYMEPGRSLVADAGLTLYTVGSVKTPEGHEAYVSVNGGMTDNPRYTLYESEYTVLLASRINDNCDLKATVAGRCCESGDILQENVLIPKPQRGDILAVCTTGAYNYAMASNYNRVGRPAVVFLKESGDYLAIRRETVEDICSLDI